MAVDDLLSLSEPTDVVKANKAIYFCDGLEVATQVWKAWRCDDGSTNTLIAWHVNLLVQWNSGLCVGI